MNSGFYHPGVSPLHQCFPGLKILALLLVCCAVFIVDHIVVIALVAVLVCALYCMAKIPLSVALRQIRPVLVFLGIIFILQGVLVDWPVAIKVVVRFGTLIFAAALLTLTTRSADMLDALELGLKPLAWLGLNTGKISLALSLAIRFIPIIAGVTQEVREAQRVRGRERSVFAVAVPTLIRTLKMADDIADAIDARGYDPDRSNNPVASKPRGG